MLGTITLVHDSTYICITILSITGSHESLNQEKGLQGSYPRIYKILPPVSPSLDGYVQNTHTLINTCLYKGINLLLVVFGS